MHKTPFAERMDSPLVDVIGTLAGLPGPGMHGCAVSGLEMLAARWATRLLVLFVACLGGLLLAEAFHRIAPLSDAAVSGKWWVGAVALCLAAGSTLLSIVSEVASAVAHFRHFGSACQQEAAHDHEMANRLACYPLETLEAADCWLEQKVRRMERRQLRLLGGSDKLALPVMMVAGWAAWKELCAMLSSWQLSPLLCGMVFLVGLVLGGAAAARKADRLAYQRDLLRIAKTWATDVESFERTSVAKWPEFVIPGGAASPAWRRMPRLPA